MGKWTRRGFIAAGLVGGGVLAVGVGIREGHRAPKLAHCTGELVDVLVRSGSHRYVEFKPLESVLVWQEGE